MGLKPTARYKRITDIPVSEIKEMGITLVLADMDNTLALWRSTETVDGIENWLSEVSKADIRVALFTNSKGAHADAIGERLGISVFKNAKKPFKKPLKALLNELGVSPECVLMVGDQLFTDIQLANAVGAKSVLTEPLSDREWWATKVFNRSRERIVWRFLFK